MAKVLACGVYLANQNNCAAEAIAELDLSQDHHLEQRWIALDVTNSGNNGLPHTFSTITRPTPKFTLLNWMLADVSHFDAVLILDDDVMLPRRFLDRYLRLATQYKFALSQPARTRDSYIDHSFTMQMPGLVARLTRFVEIGPVFCIDREAFEIILPFDASSPMGWGLDFVWPAKIERSGKRMGIIDALPVSHSLRKPVTNYSRNMAEGDMNKLLSGNDHHLSRAEAFTLLEAYA
jgi:hypothetical protein